MVGKKIFEQVFTSNNPQTVEIVEIIDQAPSSEYVEFETTPKPQTGNQHQLKAGTISPALKVVKPSLLYQITVSPMKKTHGRNGKSISAPSSGDNASWSYRWKLERTEKAVMAKATRIGADIVSRLRGRRWTRAEVSLSVSSRRRNSNCNLPLNLFSKSYAIQAKNSMKKEQAYE